jgi:hypothetical protein
MNEILEQIILASRRKGPKGWGNILFIVFLAIFWAISAILKLKAKKAEDEKEGQEQLGLKPGAKPPEVTKALPKGPFQQIRRAIETELQKQRQLQEQPEQRKLARPQPAAQKVAAKTEPATQIPVLEPVEEAKLTRPTAQVQTKFQEMPDFTSKTVKKLKDKRIDSPSEILQAKHLAEILLDYSDPDELKRAILHYEILGRPLSLRDPLQHIIGL